MQSACGSIAHVDATCIIKVVLYVFQAAWAIDVHCMCVILVEIHYTSASIYAVCIYISSCICEHVQDDVI